MTSDRASRSSARRPTVDEAIAVIRRHEPDVVLLDVHLPGRRRPARHRGQCATTRSKTGSSPCRCRMPPRTSSRSCGPAPRIRHEDDHAEELLDAIERVHDGDAVFSPRLAGFVLDAFAGDLPMPADPELDQLTAREQEVLRLIARGYTYKEIAGRLHLSVKTIESHVSSVLRKLQLTNRHQLTAWANERRMV